MPKLAINLKATDKKEVAKLTKALKTGSDAKWRQTFRAGMAMCIG